VGGRERKEGKREGGKEGKWERGREGGREGGPVAVFVILFEDLVDLFLIFFICLPSCHSSFYVIALETAVYLVVACSGYRGQIEGRLIEGLAGWAGVGRFVLHRSSVRTVTLPPTNPYSTSKRQAISRLRL